MSGFSFLKPPASSAASTGGLFGAAPAPASGGLFGAAPAQQSGGLFGQQNQQQPQQQSTGLFGQQNQQQPQQQSTGLFGQQNQQQPQQQATGLFGQQNQQQPQQQSTGLFGNTGGQQQQSGGLFSNTQNQQQPQQQAQPGGLFGNTGGLFSNTQNQQQPGQTGGMFGGLGGSQQQQQNKPNLLNLNLNQSSTQRTGTQPQIDIEHLRPTTKFDHLTPDLQSQIEALDQHILGEIHKCSELSGALPSIVDSGRSVPEDYKYVKEKFDELEIALENDAADIVDLRDKVVRRDVAEGRLCFKSVDRLKMPAQYQSHHHGHHDGRAVTEAVYGGSGLSGWWNNPTMSTRTRHGAQKNVLSVDADDDVEVAGGTLVDLLTGRADEMSGMLKESKEMLEEIEGFVGNVEGKIVAKEREMIDGPQGIEGERERQIKMLRYVFGEVERSLYEVADRVGESRDGLMELGERSAKARMAF